MKQRFLAPLLALALLLAACGQAGTADEAPPAESGAAAPQAVELSLWCYPVGGWSSETVLAGMVSAFRREHPDVHISVRMLTYADGDAAVEEAIEAGTPPDLIFEGPERLAANWGARGLMADLGDLWQDEAAAQVYAPVAAACRSGNGAHYIYPVCMTTHCMAINRDVFEAAGAWQYVDEEHHTWTTEGFAAAVRALRAWGIERVGEVYCGGQGGDQGTRALVTNLYSGTFTDAAHTRYTFNSQENIRALELLQSLDGIVFDPEAVGADVIDRFAAGEVPMCFCWNVGNEVTKTISEPDRAFDIFPMAFPSDNGRSELQGGIWGFGVFDNGDAARIGAAKDFIRFLTQNTERYTQTVLSTTFWPARDVPNIYENDELMTEYFALREYLGDYYQVTPGWAEARTAWWTMLQKVGAGGDAASAAAAFEAAANAAAAAG